MAAYERGIQLDSSQPCKPIENCFVESFKGVWRDEWLPKHSSISLSEAGLEIEAWWQGYNRMQPHRALGGLLPSVFRAAIPAECGLPALLFPGHIAERYPKVADVRSPHRPWHQRGEHVKVTHPNKKRRGLQDASLLG